MRHRYVGLRLLFLHEALRQRPGGASSGRCNSADALCMPKVVYDPLRKEHYVFGGHPDSKEPVDYRLADMWRLRIVEYVSLSCC